MKSKKGAIQLTLEQLTKLILLSVIIILVFIPLGANLYGYYFPGIDKELKQSLKTLITEAEDLKTDIEKHGAINPSIPAQVYLQKDTRVIAYESNEKEAPRKCKTKSCLCIFQIKENRDLFACKILKGVQIENTQIIAEANSTGLFTINMAAEEKGNNIILQIT
jgi:hypothetical protein